MAQGRVNLLVLGCCIYQCISETGEVGPLCWIYQNEDYTYHCNSSTQSVLTALDILI